MTAILTKRNRKLRLEIEPGQLENLLDIAGLYNPDFIKALRESDLEIRKGQIKKRKTLMDIVDD